MSNVAYRAWREVKRRLAFRSFSGSQPYWEERYATGGTSGSGSSGRLREFKANTVNRIIDDFGVQSVVELGCGDGQILDLLQVDEYTGVDISPTVIQANRHRFSGVPGRRFVVAGEQPGQHAELALSMDVILHLVEDDVFDRYMEELFTLGQRLVVIYPDDEDIPARWPHERHREFSRWVRERADRWRLLEVVPPPWPHDPASPDETSNARFHIYQRGDEA